MNGLVPEIRHFINACNNNNNKIISPTLQLEYVNNFAVKVSYPFSYRLLFTNTLCVCGECERT